MRLVAAVLDDSAAAEEGGVHVVREAEGRAEAAEVRPRAGGRMGLAREEDDDYDDDDKGDEGIQRAA